MLSLASTLSVLPQQLSRALLCGSSLSFTSHFHTWQGFYQCARQHAEERAILSSSFDEPRQRSQQDDAPLFERILVANRGEIACRIIRTARRMGIETLAVFSDADADALHARLADTAVNLGGVTAQESYLNIDKIVKICKDFGVDAVHPGYGFLSENLHFAAALHAAGITFIGPSSESIAAMGDKIESKRIARQASVNTIPGIEGVVHDSAQARREAELIGYPVMLKASAGGGGKGMRFAWTPDELDRVFGLCAEEAKGAFGDGRLLMEKLIVAPRHIEIQVLGDKHGNVVYLPERECSIQRRNQKVIEEAPSPFIDADTRAAMGRQAVALCKAVNYYSAGTLEFLVDKQRNFYFLEMNTRLQVEHPVTEAITGLDLVEQMIRVAAGQRLSLTQEQASRRIDGWAMEARVYAEDPTRGYLPSTGTLTSYQEPHGHGVRVDSGVTEGSKISIYYDPMISKVVTHARTRDDAISAMCRALDRYVVRGVAHNIPLLRSVIAHPRFKAGNIDTAFLADEFPTPESTDPRRAAITPRQQNEFATAAILYFMRRWRALYSGEFMPMGSQLPLVLTMDGDAMHVQVTTAAGEMVGQRGLVQGALEIEFADKVVDAFLIQPYVRQPDPTAAPPPSRAFARLPRAWSHRDSTWLLKANIDGHQISFQVLTVSPRSILLQHDGAQREVFVDSAWTAPLLRHMPPRRTVDTSKEIRSPMPGALISLAVAAGDEVQAGQEVAVVEAMKMRNILRAERACVVASVEAQAGTTLAADQVILRIK